MSEFYYHGTKRQHMPGIVREGLLAIPPEREWGISQDCVYLASDVDYARGWGGYGGQKVVLRVDLEGLDGPVCDDGNLPHSEPAFEYWGDIPPEHLEINIDGYWVPMSRYAKILANEVMEYE